MIELSSLQIHNDVRIHPQKPSARVFQSSQGYKLRWYPPDIFLVECSYLEGSDERIVQRWFATTNCEHWTVAGDDPEKAEAEMLAAASIIQSELRDIKMALAEIIKSMRAKKA